MVNKKDAKLRILVVEDDFMVRQVIRDILEVYGTVDIAVNGEEATPGLSCCVAQTGAL